MLLIAAFARRGDRVRPRGCAGESACLRCRRDDCGAFSGQRAVANAHGNPHAHTYAYSDANADPEPIADANPDTDT